MALGILALDSVCSHAMHSFEQQMRGNNRRSTTMLTLTARTTLGWRMPTEDGKHPRIQVVKDVWWRRTDSLCKLEFVHPTRSLLGTDQSRLPVPQWWQGWGCPGQMGKTEENTAGCTEEMVGPHDMHCDAHCETCRREDPIQCTYILMSCLVPWIAQNRIAGNHQDLHDKDEENVARARSRQVEMWVPNVGVSNDEQTEAGKIMGVSDRDHDVTPETNSYFLGQPCMQRTERTYTPRPVGCSPSDAGAILHTTDWHSNKPRTEQETRFAGTSCGKTIINLWLIKGMCGMVPIQHCLDAYNADLVRLDKNGRVCGIRRGHHDHVATACGTLSVATQKESSGIVGPPHIGLPLPCRQGVHGMSNGH